MDKNTIWAIVLSTLVIIASYLILPKFFPGLNPAMGRQAAQIEENTELSEPQELDLSAMEENAAVFAEADDAESDSLENEAQPALVEQKYTIKTDKVEVVFTNKGGDIISYKLGVCIRYKYFFATLYGKYVKSELFTDINLRQSFSVPVLRYFDLVDKVIVIQMDKVQDTVGSTFCGDTECRLFLGIYHFIGSVFK